MTFCGFNLIVTGQAVPQPLLQPFNLARRRLQTCHFQYYNNSMAFSLKLESIPFTREPVYPSISWLQECNYDFAMSCTFRVLEGVYYEENITLFQT